MDIITDGIATFFQSGIGIALQILAFIGALIPGLKYLSNRFDMKIDKNIDKRINPIISNLCEQLQTLGTGLSTFKASTDTALVYINEAIRNLQNLYTKDDTKESEHFK